MFKHRPSQRDRRVTRRGFTLVEIIVVVTIIAILAGIIVPRIIGNVGKANVSRAKTEAKSLATVITNYMLDSNVSTLDNMFTLDTLLLTPDDGGGPNGPYLQKADDLNDPWGTPYQLRIPGTVNYDFDVVSAGEDKTFDTEDDVTN